MPQMWTERQDRSGGWLLAAARWPTNDRLTGTGPESLVVMETGRWTRPRWSLAWRLAVHHASLLAVAVLAAASVALLLH